MAMREAFTRYHHFISEGKEVNRLINDMIYFVRDTIMSKTADESMTYDALADFDLEMKCTIWLILLMIRLFLFVLVSIRTYISKFY